MPGKDVIFEKENKYETSVFYNQQYFASIKRNKYLDYWKITLVDENAFPLNRPREFATYMLAKDYLITVLSCI